MYSNPFRIFCSAGFMAMNCLCLSSKVLPISLVIFKMALLDLAAFTGSYLISDFKISLSVLFCLLEL